jgi:CHAD domain-containing protein
MAADRTAVLAELEAVYQKRAKPSKKHLFRGVIRKKDSVDAAARKLGYSQYRVMVANEEGVRLGEDPECLHDFRVAARRIRAVIKLFPELLAAFNGEGMDDDLAWLGDQLGPVRDMQVWIEYLEGIRDQVGADPAWSAYLADQQAINRSQLEQARQVLNSERYGRSMQRLAAWLGAPEKDGQPPVRPYAAACLRKTLKRVVAYRKNMTDESPEAMHDLRRLCRRERYWAEFMGPVLGAECEKLGRRLKAVADALGDLHDMDVHLARQADEDGRSVPSALITVMQKHRGRALKAFHRSWKKLTDADYRKQVLKSLKVAKT